MMNRTMTKSATKTMVPRTDAVSQRGPRGAPVFGSAWECSQWRRVVASGAFDSQWHVDELRNSLLACWYARTDDFLFCV